MGDYQQQHQFVNGETLTHTLLNAEFAAIETAFDSYELVKKRTRVLFSDFTESSNGTAESITMFTIPAGSLILNALTYVTTQFTGGGVSTCTMAFGDGDVDDLLEEHDVLGCGNTTWIHELETGTDKGDELFSTFMINKFYASATAITATAVTDGGQALDDLTAGDLYSFIIYTTLSIV